MPGNPYEGRQYGYCGGGYGYCGTPASGSVLLLDNLAATYGAWSVARKIKTSFSAAAGISQIRRDSDNDELITPLLANGVDVDVAAVESFLNGANGYYTRIANQDAEGSALDFLQSTTTIQPIAAEAGSMILENGKPAAKFNKSTQHRISVPASGGLFKFLSDGTKSIITWVSKSDASATMYWFIVTNRGTTPGLEITYSTAKRIGLWVYNYSVVATASEADSSQSVFSLTIDADASPASARASLWSSGSLRTFVNAATVAPSSLDAAGNLTLGGRDNLGLYSGTIQELIVWPTDESASRTTWEADMADFYGVALA